MTKCLAGNNNTQIAPSFVIYQTIFDNPRVNALMLNHDEENKPITYATLKFLT